MLKIKEFSKIKKIIRNAIIIILVILVEEVVGVIVIIREKLRNRSKIKLVIKFFLLKRLADYIKNFRIVWEWTNFYICCRFTDKKNNFYSL